MAVEVRVRSGNWMTYMGVFSATTAAALSGWVGYRLYLRSETLRELNRTRAVRVGAIAEYLSAGLGVDLNIPTAEELATALVPIWDTTSPYRAIEDVLQHGRQSRYWPDKYRQSGDVEALEPALFELAEALYRSGDNPDLLEAPR